MWVPFNDYLSWISHYTKSYLSIAIYRFGYIVIYLYIIYLYAYVDRINLILKTTIIMSSLHVKKMKVNMVQ
jgi:hypothetical protein